MLGLHCVSPWIPGLSQAIPRAQLSVHAAALVSVNLLAAPGAARGHLLSVPPLLDRQTGSGC